MPYDRGGVTMLPNIAGTGADSDVPVAYIAAAGTQLGGTFPMPCKGRVVGLAIQPTVATVAETTAGYLGIEIAGVEVMTVLLEDNLAIDAWQFTLGELVSGANGEFAAGDVIGVDVSVKGLEGGAEAGTGKIHPLVIWDQGP